MQENAAWVTYASKIQSDALYHQINLFSQECDPAK